MGVQTEFTVKLENRPGTIADLLEVVAAAGVNVDGLQGMPCAGEGIMQFVTDYADKAAQALEDAGVHYQTRSVLLLGAKNQPGEGARITRAMADANVNVDGMYVTLTGQVVLGVDNLSAAQDVASSLGLG